MQKLRYMFSVLLAIAILPFNGIPSAAASFTRADQRAVTNNYVNLYIDEVKILGNIGDLTGRGEFRLIVLASDSSGKSSGMFCPAGSPLKMSKGDTVYSPCLLAISFDEAKVSDEVYLTVMVVDEDKSTLPTELSYEAASSYLGTAFGKAVKKGLLKVGAAKLAKSTPFTFTVSVLFDLLTGKIKEWIQKADVIGSQGIYLTRKDSWAEDKTTTIKSNDGGIQITYTIVHTSSAPANQKGPTLGSPASSGQSTTSSYWCDDLSKVRLKVGDSAKVVWPKVNLRSAPIVPMEYYENSLAKVDEGTKLSIIGGPACAHNGTWWQVRLASGKTGWMREYISSGYLIGK